MAAAGLMIPPAEDKDREIARLKTELAQAVADHLASKRKLAAEKNKMRALMASVTCWEQKLDRMANCLEC